MLTAALLAMTGCEATNVQRVARLRFELSPTAVVAGEPFTVTVELVGPDGARAVGETRTVRLALFDPDTITLVGETSVTTVDGLATFTDMSIFALAPELRFIATSGTMRLAGAPFLVRSGPASPGESSISPVPGNIPPNRDVPFTFTFKDSRGFPVANVPVSVSTTVPSGTFTPPAGTTSETGEFVSVFRAADESTGDVSALVEDVPIPGGATYTVVELCPGPVPLTFPGSADGTQPCGAYAQGVVASTVYEFTTAGGGAAFTITSAFEPLFQVKLNPSSNDVLFTVEQTPSTVEWLLPAGTYLFRVAASSGTGAFNLVGASVPGNTGDDYRTLVAEGTYTGQQLAAGDAVITDDGSYYDGFYFRSASACTITHQSAAFPPYLMVVDAATGQRVANDVTAPIGGTATIQLPACRAGTNNAVLIVANSLSAGQTGAYTLGLDVGVNPPLRAQRATSDAVRAVVRQRDAALGRLPLRKQKRP
ncbi:MAG TPA: hypothetical protein VJR92_00345 [Gemmatimonadaceae bacterium]|nr:hypothetical protein [Gemmatimonadaceae bacterium]